MVKSEGLTGFRSPMGSPVYYQEQEKPEAASLMEENNQDIDSNSEASSAVVIASPTARKSAARKKMRAVGQGVLFTKPAIFKKPICGDLFGSR